MCKKWRKSGATRHIAKKSPEIKNLLLIRMSLVRVQLPEPHFTRLPFKAVFLWISKDFHSSIMLVVKRAIFQALSNNILKKVGFPTFSSIRVKYVYFWLYSDCSFVRIMSAPGLLDFATKFTVLSANQILPSFSV